MCGDHGTVLTVADGQLLQIFECQRAFGGELERGRRMKRVLEDSSQLLQSLHYELCRQSQQVQNPRGYRSCDVM